MKAKVRKYLTVVEETAIEGGKQTLGHLAAYIATLVAGGL